MLTSLTLDRLTTAALGPKERASERPAWSLLATAICLATLFALIATLVFSPVHELILSVVRGMIEAPQLLAVFLLTYGGAFYLRALAWRALQSDNNTGVFHLFSILHVALLGNHLFPAKVGEPLRIALLAGRDVPIASATATTLIARFLDLSVVACIALVGITMVAGWSQNATALGAMLILLGIGASTACAVLMSERPQTLWQRAPKPLARLAGSTRDALTEIRLPRLMLAVALTAPSWVLEGGALWMVAQAAGVPLSFPAAVAVTAFTIAFQSLQFTPGGLGVYEVSQTSALALYGLDPVVGLGLAISAHALKFAYSYALGFPFALVEGIALSRYTIHTNGDLRAAMTRVLHGVGIAPGIVAMAVTITAPSTLTGLLPALPLFVLARCHHLPTRLLPVLAVLPFVFTLIFGVLPLTVAGIVLVLGAGWVLVAWRTQGARSLQQVFWLVLLTQATVAGASRSIEVLMFGLTTLAVVVLFRQWWLSHQPASRKTPVAPGSTVAVIVPVHNEVGAIGHVLSAMPREELAAAGYKLEVIVVDDGSTDGSAAIARVAGASRVVSHTTKRGIGAALRTGLSAAQASGAVAVAYIDGDGEYDPLDLPQVLAPIFCGEADYVLGNRFPGAVSVMCRSRLWGNRAFTLLMRLLTGRAIADAQTGCRAFSRSAIESAEIVHDYNYAQVLTLDLLRKGMRLRQVPISYRTRTTGTSFVRYRHYLLRVLPAIIVELLSP